MLYGFATSLLLARVHEIVWHEQYLWIFVLKLVTRFRDGASRELDWASPFLGAFAYGRENVFERRRVRSVWTAPGGLIFSEMVLEN